MTPRLRPLLMLALTLLPLLLPARSRPEAPVDALLERIGGPGTAGRFIIELRPSLAEGSREAFEISSRGGKPMVAGSSIPALTAGINWYLNHTAHVNLTWNHPRADLASRPLPLPEQKERRVAQAEYRYYLNYCTYSYSAAFWDWQRWQQEIDWMALHGINMPLALVGTDVVWRQTLLELGYDDAEIARFIAGPAFQAWWLMGNLQGWGGPNPQAWYRARARLARRILRRMRELGMEPVLPGYAGMLPADAGTRLGYDVKDTGTWCGFRRPAFLLPTDARFSGVAALYYKHLSRLMGTSRYYSIDPFHEGGNTQDVNLPAAYAAIWQAVRRVSPEARWIIQSWNENPRPECLQTIPKGRLIVLDLFSDGQPKWRNGYGGHDMIFCMLHNFGGRTGLHGRYETTISGFYEALSRYPKTLKGIGATPEGIETNPMLYDMLFELPWRSEAEMTNWLPDYAEARYGLRLPEAAQAWEELRRSVYSCRTQQQGTSEPVECARPALHVNSVSTWSTTALYYDTASVVRAAALLLACRDRLAGNANYAYDLVDVTRQALTNRAHALAGQIAPVLQRKDTAALHQLREAFLTLILDQDRLLSTMPHFTLGRWTAASRQLAAEISPEDTAFADRMERNARLLVSVWGTEQAANAGGLHDYSNREWAGLLRDFHHARWQRFFNCLENGQPLPTDAEWYREEEAWTRNMKLHYSPRPTGNPIDTAVAMFRKYFGEPEAFLP